MTILLPDQAGPGPMWCNVELCRKVTERLKF
jgi:hypothetical protein